LPSDDLTTLPWRPTLASRSLMSLPVELNEPALECLSRAQR
jgi:hypothetical protein